MRRKARVIARRGPGPFRNALAGAVAALARDAAQADQARLDAVRRRAFSQLVSLFVTPVYDTCLDAFRRRLRHRFPGVEIGARASHGLARIDSRG